MRGCVVQLSPLPGPLPQGEREYLADLSRRGKGRLEGGYSLIELVMVIVIVGIVGTTVAALLSGGVGAFTAGREAVDTLSELRLTSERLARELRTVRRDPATPTDFEFLTKTDTTVQFRRWDDDTNATLVTIAASGSDLTVDYDTVPGGPYILSNSLGSLDFDYLDSNGAETADNADVAFIDIELSLVDSATPPNSYPQRTRVALRNRQ